ncbi:Vacuolar protein sorting-associated protein 11 [Cymbomonas tetramitiformis]|uniref:Vacuolar protein sorting-associated protein 11 homolog n=1 Tax=Cymbomonas tetramitiformis TaxID=36881 RepID=A0AAE0GVV3_9CHLO|nr:Vacuolar protein sorting-associated protein 11 [Cymbomonas tetramitiformis]
MWRKFQFFEKENIKVLDQKFGLRSSFRAHDVRVTHLQQLSKHRNLLVSLGEDDLTNPLASTSIKLWDFDKFSLDEETSSPPCLRSLRIFAYKFPEVQVTSFLAAEEGASQLVVAVGLENGQVYVIRGDVARDKVSRSRLMVPVVEKEASTGRPAAPPGVTGLGFRLEAGHAGGALILFAVTRSLTSAFDLDRQGHKAVLDDHGCDTWCVTMTEAQELVVGCPEAVYFYEAEGRGACFAFDGEKRHLACFRGYLLVISQASSRLGGAAKTSQLSIYDLKNKLIAYSMGIGDVVHVLCEFGSVTVLQADNTAFCLREKDTSAKMEMLFRKNLYSVAITLIQTQSTDRGAAADVQRKYGDHLYSKGDFDGAMTQYLQTIGWLEPSYVIRQFLDARRIHNLTTYLEALHTKSLATADHTTLLLNCYTKLKSVGKLEEFIRANEDETQEDYSKRFDVETALKVCRAAGYHQHALQVAWRAGEHEWYLRILLEDVCKYDDALEYLMSLPAEAAQQALKKYGKVLAEHRPELTTDLLMRLCSPQMAGTSSSLVQAHPEEFIHIFVERPKCLLRFLEHNVSTAATLPSVREEARLPPAIYNTLLELYLRPSLTSRVEGAAALPAPRSGDDAAGPMAGMSEEAKESDAEEEADYKERLERALGLLQSGWPAGGTPVYDMDHALMLCQVQGYAKGTIYLYERMKLYKEVLACHMAAEDYSGLLECCQRLGQEEPELWVEALSFFGGQERECSREVTQALAHIERGQLLAPLVVLQTLAANPRLTLSVVKDYIAQHIAEETRLVEEDRAAIRKYHEETNRYRAEVEELRTQARIFQQSKCTACTAALDLPAVHFMCMHSFHARCLGDNERECPKCTADYRTVLEIKRSLENSLSDHDSFFQLLENSEDGFSVVADYFGRGIFLPQKTRDDPQHFDSLDKGSAFLNH